MTNLPKVSVKMEPSKPRPTSTRFHNEKRPKQTLVLTYLVESLRQDHSSLATVRYAKKDFVSCNHSVNFQLFYAFSSKTLGSVHWSSWGCHSAKNHAWGMGSMYLHALMSSIVILCKNSKVNFRKICTVVQVVNTLATCCQGAPSFPVDKWLVTFGGSHTTVVLYHLYICIPMINKVNEGIFNKRYLHMYLRCTVYITYYINLYSIYRFTRQVKRMNNAIQIHTVGMCGRCHNGS